MENIEEKLLQYSQLSPEERLAVDRYVEAHPELAPLLNEARALAALFKEASGFYRPSPDEEALAYYAATQHFQHHTPPASLRAAFDRLERTLSADPALQARYRALEQRLQHIEAQSDPRAQFERLTGHRLEADSETTADADRSARIYPMPLRVTRWAAAAAVVFLAVYGVLLLASRAGQSELDRLAALHPDELSVEGYDPRTRGGILLSDTTSSDARYLRALAILKEARRTTLGLFPRYDQEQLAEATGLLEEVRTREAATPGSFLQLEATYLLGKIRLLQGDTARAETAFRTVVSQEGRRAQEAVRILAALSSVER